MLETKMNIFYVNIHPSSTYMSIQRSDNDVVTREISCALLIILDKHIHIFIFTIKISTKATTSTFLKFNF
jgi:hypothetical protein